MNDESPPIPPPAAEESPKLTMVTPRRYGKVRGVPHIKDMRAHRQQLHFTLCGRRCYDWYHAEWPSEWVELADNGVCVRCLIAARRLSWHNRDKAPGLFQSTEEPCSNQLNLAVSSNAHAT